MASTDQPKNRKPTHGVFHVRGEGKSAFWTKIGAAWIHEDGAGLNVSADFIPVGGSPVVARAIFSVAGYVLSA